MFCYKCGAKIDEDSTFCPYCGTQTGVPSNTAQQQQPYYRNPQQYNNSYQNPQQNYRSPAQQNNALAIVGFVLSFFVPIAGLICSILGYKAAKNNGAPLGSLAKAGIIISAVSMGITALVYIIYGSMLSAFFAALLSAPGGI